MGGFGWNEFSDRVSDVMIRCVVSECKFVKYSPITTGHIIL